MSMKMTRESFDQLIAENIGWLVKNSPDCLERNHIVSVLGCASESHYGRQSEIDRLTRELAEAKARESARKAIAKVYGGTKMSSDYTQSPSGLPPVPYWLTLYDKKAVEAYGHACGEHVRAPLIRDLAECFNIGGSDADGNGDEWRAANALRSVRQLRADYDEACDEGEKLRARIAELEAALVLPAGPWRQWWQGSGPERGDHIMSRAGRVAYLPAPDGTEGLHDQAGEIVYAHNVALSEIESARDRLRAEVEAKAGEIEALRADAARWAWRMENPTLRLVHSCGCYRVENWTTWYTSANEAVDAAISAAKLIAARKGEGVAGA